MSLPAPLTQPNALTAQASLPGPMRRPSLGSSPPLLLPTQATATATATAAAATGTDVTPTSPSAAATGQRSLLSIRPLPSPSLYQPSVVASVAPPSVRQREASVVSLSSTTSNEYSPPLPLPSSASSVSSVGDASSGAFPTTSTSSSSTTAATTVSTMKYKENTGRWLTEEHDMFLRGLDEHGKQWKKIAILIKTRSVVQVRTHAQKYFQKLLKGDKKDESGHLQRLSSSSGGNNHEHTNIMSASAAAAAAVSPGGKRKSSASKGNKAGSTKKRRVSLEPKPKKQRQTAAVPTHYQCQPQPVVMDMDEDEDHTVIDPSFMHSLNMSEGELDDSLLDLLDDSSVSAVEQVIGVDDDDLEPNPVSPSVSSMSLVDNTNMHVTMPRTVSVGADQHSIGRQDMVSSPDPTEDFSIHNTASYGAVSVQELSPTCVAHPAMDIKDFEQKAGTFTDALDWLMDDGWRQLPASDTEVEQENWSGIYPKPSSASAADKVTQSAVVASSVF